MLNCSHVVGYRESTTIHDDVCIMAVTGTAVALRKLEPSMSRIGSKAQNTQLEATNGCVLYYK